MLFSLSLTVSLFAENPFIDIHANGTARLCLLVAFSPFDNWTPSKSICVCQDIVLYALTLFQNDKWFSPFAIRLDWERFTTQTEIVHWCLKTTLFMCEKIDMIWYKLIRNWNIHLDVWNDTINTQTHVQFVLVCKQNKW